MEVLYQLSYPGERAHCSEGSGADSLRAMDRAETTRMTKRWIVGGALVTIGIGLFIAFTIGWYGWAIVAFGVIDLTAMPFWLGRMGGASQQAQRDTISTGDPGAAPAEAPVEASADPSYNPYARED